MWSPLLLATAFAAIVSATDLATGLVVGSLCDCEGHYNCYNQGAFGCVRLLEGGGQNCVNPPTDYRFCSQQCGGQFYVYQKANSDDDQCVCSYYDARLSSQLCVAPPPSPNPPPTPFTPQPIPPQATLIQGTQCGNSSLSTCQAQGAWGCVSADLDYCIDQTKECDAACGFFGFAYQKRNSGDRRCVCSSQDLAQSADSDNGDNGGGDEGGDDDDDDDDDDDEDEDEEDDDDDGDDDDGSGGNGGM
ncbi:hypothetical protein AC578_2668 [Pseudocercospora eumusae]|uniref:Uncharacterized protein n=1 Tax=Pseudocercospora eumusae TaxID=321146 RepID=A0A139H128_9PEZI|nr:hypothetical protein AC578_2668 [Pseudocercospora eumusae]